jgi:hypothetical protein
LQVLSGSVFILAGVAPIASPGPRRGRQLLTWRHGAVLLLAAATVQVSTVMYEAMSPFLRFLTRTAPGITVYFAVSVALAVATLLCLHALLLAFAAILSAVIPRYCRPLAAPEPKGPRPT